ncbi:MAG TPA: hypothetical protein VF585_00040 [Chthoniobacterales bacterium]
MSMHDEEEISPAVGGPAFIDHLSVGDGIDGIAKIGILATNALEVVA